MEKILKFWKRKCLENCSNIPLKEIYGDQNISIKLLKSLRKLIHLHSQELILHRGIFAIHQEN